jgi:hypothetical protein
MSRLVLVLALAALVAPRSADAFPVAALSCPSYVDFFAVRASDGASCSTVKRVQKALYRKGFNAVDGSRQLVQVGGDAWRCKWRSGSTAPRVSCSNLEGRGKFTGKLSVDL